MKKWYVDDVFVRNGKVYDRGYYIREDGFIEWTEPIPNGRTFEFPISECYHPAGPLSLEPGDPISVEDGKLLGTLIDIIDESKKRYVIFKKQPAFGQTRVGEFISEDTVHFFDLREDTPEEREKAKAEGYRYAYLFSETYGYYGDTRYVYVGYEIL